MPYFSKLLTEYVTSCPNLWNFGMMRYYKDINTLYWHFLIQNGIPVSPLFCDESFAH